MLYLPAAVATTAKLNWSCCSKKTESLVLEIFMVVVILHSWGSGNNTQMSRLRQSIPRPIISHPTSEQLSAKCPRGRRQQQSGGGGGSGAAGA